MRHELSKSTFMRGLKCEKCLYLNKHHHHLRDKLTSEQEAIFEQGTNVGELAQQLHPGGENFTPVSYYDFGPSIKATKQAIAKGTPVIYEAAFLFNGVLVAMDILVKSPKGYKAFEVKSSTSVKDTYVKDAALQAYVIRNSGVSLEDVSIVYLNKKYKRAGNLDITQLFKTESIWDQIIPLMDTIPEKIEKFKTLLKSSNAPQKDIGLHCQQPYSCDFMGHCWENVPVYSVFDINNLNVNKRFDLYHSGCTTLDQIPADYPLSANQRLQVQSEINQTVHIEKEAIASFLSELNYPIYHIDFETMSHAVPQFDGATPYGPIVFQYSMHIQENIQSVPIHKEFIGDGNKNDPRRKFAEKLILDSGTHGDVLVYNIGFERGKLNALISLFPDLSAGLQAIINRMKDLMVPFQSKWYYTPEMKGSHSLKYVFPAVAPDFEYSYSGLTIQNGSTASLVYSQMVTGTYKGDYDQAQLDLLEYCKLDTLAMVKLLEKLYLVSK